VYQTPEVIINLLPDYIEQARKKLPTIYRTKSGYLLKDSQPFCY